MKVAFFEIKDWEKEYFQKSLVGHELLFFTNTLKTSDLTSIKDIEILVVFIYSHITKDILDNLPNLKMIVTMSTGFDHIDIAECKKKNIIVTNIPSYGEITVAEHAFALIFSISRRIIESHERVKNGDFSPEGLTGFDLYEKTLGVVGVGTIGRHVIRIAKGIGMNVLGYKRTPDPDLEKELGFRLVDLPELFEKSDIITIHIPYSQQTHHFINSEVFSKMKNGVIIINTSRGAIIDTTALLQVLDSGKVAAAGLDVLEEEPILTEEKALLSQEFDKDALVRTLEDHILLNRKNVVITPHNAFNSREALERIMKTTLENITSYLSKNPINTV
ncbi:MAG: hydroxyacid dehydrogenase [Candidatus Levybacteria bacterium CG_4_10_14_0_2_um_filter_36_16]|nr:MAG: hypothetical protein AUK12_01040 [Candidatus Levybacteria bacterium CG2_30_37_29]PIR78960.1 MAG: hydroxyacid dehydrogenase [Candidatus Levybacteria bacterium CG10_big_fil_rev_8_21_14_0_10_36_30]PIZ97257.1 MAG: hydroxyacid dehydrogenase [Candidatus Levybacteria bacterium CG_4_10_14_0_2_um_filter_36_16]PJA90165.1 MAG: hydroxyacid dehydrogenase [Candidatus Levybacteria bacterium CG_4_9_14_3_um_filter_36_7]